MKIFKIKQLHTKSYKAFTMVELLLYMGLLTIVLSVLTTIFVTIIDLQLESESLSNVQKDSRFIAARLFYDINRADSVSSPALSDTASTLQIVVDGINYQYTLNASGDLELTSGSETHILNSYSTTVSALSFRRIGNVDGKHSIQVDLNIISDIEDAGEDESKRLRTTIGIR